MRSGFQGRRAPGSKADSTEDTACCTSNLLGSNDHPDNNFSLQQTYNSLAQHICKLAARLARQECKCETSLQQVNGSFEVTTRRTCSKLAMSNSLQA
ncbi:hypothetical protein AVEN_189068-1 [Araneus ventricosus]|uniref:Uncharacterized protein n=1 Tax=Araneus ventricosus TaxID=182803 RepID=A0A4Y2JKA3_ARAVE|nr:hypothetical protein AVEN_189068-1 [Araneus ventricosus]